MHETHTVVSAGPGWFVATLIEHSEPPAQPYLIFDQVIAWSITRYFGEPNEDGDTYHGHLTSPITEDGDPCGGNEWGLKRPDGTFSICGDRCFDKESDFLQALAEDFKERREHLARRPGKP